MYWGEKEDKIFRSVLSHHLPLGKAQFFGSRFGKLMTQNVFLFVTK